MKLDVQLHSVGEVDIELCNGLCPVLSWHTPFLRDVPGSQEEQFHD